MSHPLHQKALNLALEFKRVEADLVDVIQQIEAKKLFRQMGYASLFEYVNRGLGLTEGVSYALILVSRRSAVVPELKIAIQTGELSVSQAKRVASVITKENAPGLIEKAKTLTQKEIEKVVAQINPQAVTPERARHVTEDRVKLEVYFTEAAMEKLKRIQDLESQRTSSPCNFEQALLAAMDIYLEKKDPIKKSERTLHKQSLRIAKQQNQELQTEDHGFDSTPREAAGRNEDPSVSPIDSEVTNLKQDELENTQSNRHISSRRKVKRTRILITAETKHKVNQRDQGQCTYKDDQGRRCPQRRWIDVHHIIAVSQGGDNSLGNLTTLCHAHHKMHHDYASKNLTYWESDFDYSMNHSV